MQNITQTTEPITPATLHPVRTAVMVQTWRDLTFLHWSFDPGAVRRLLPAQLELDLFDGKAWIGLVPFLITGLTLPHGPSMPWLSRFPETNVRTYVTGPSGRRGVWFFSLDAARVLAVLGARTGFGLPYFWSRMRVTRAPRAVNYDSRRVQGPAAHSHVVIEPGERIEQASELELFLTARFCLYAVRFGSLIRADIEHQPWPLHRGRVERLSQTLVEAAGLPSPAGDPLVHFAPRVDVRVAAPQPAAT
ncbi:MAG TPA: DUF2071 domain-containing protein [Bryobacteraceae bacterium]|nr:DUF2071 domain-containing protein [Bryobacteraceae bacterium]